MKVARVEHAKGPMVVKVFVFSDQFCHVEFYRDQLQQIGRRLLSHPNCASFSRIYVIIKKNNYMIFILVDSPVCNSLSPFL